MTESLGVAFPRELARNRRLLDGYRDLGPVGTFGAYIIGGNIEAAERALAEGDVVAMVRLYPALRDAE